MAAQIKGTAIESNPLDAAVAMRLAFWSYPHADVTAAEKITKYPDSWEYAQPGKHLPPGFNEAVRDPSGRITQEGWNTQHNAEGKLENQFKVSINEATHQITFDFKGSDAWSNWKSDLGNAGASEFAQIQEQAQKALEALQQDERYKGYSYAATGHSLGGGMAQSFALHNQLDAYVYNSLPMARDTIAGDYFKEQGGFQAALAQYKDSGRSVHDVRTPNDIATFTFEGVMQNQYLSQHIRPGAEVLPGAAVPDLLKAALVFSKVGTVPALAIMGKDHTMGALLDAQQGLGVDERSGRYRIPEGQVDFAAIPPNVRKQFALLDHSPVTKVFQHERGGTTEGDSSAYDRFEVQREDGSTQRLSVHKASGDVEIDHRHPDGRRTVLEFNPKEPEQVKTTQYDAQGAEVKSEVVQPAAAPVATPTTRAATSAPAAAAAPAAAHAGAPGTAPAPGMQTVQAANASQPGAHEAHTDPGPGSPMVSPSQEAQRNAISAKVGPHLASQHLTPDQVERVSTALLSHVQRHADKGEATNFLVAKDGSHILVRHGEHVMSEMPIAQAIAKPVEQHVAEATTTQHIGAAAPAAHGVEAVSVAHAR